MSEYADDLIAAGLYDPEAANGAALLELFEYLLDELDVSIPELVQAYESGAAMSLSAFKTLNPGERMTLAEVAAQAEVDEEFALQLWRCIGFPEPRPFERRLGLRDVELFQVFGLLNAFVELDQIFQLARTLGEAVSRIAEAEIALMRSNIEAPLAQSGRYVEVARQYRDVALELFPRIAASIDTVHRHHLEAVGRRYSDVSAPTSALNVVQLAVGFADIAGYTGMWEEREVHELAQMLSRFEATTGDVIHDAGANVVKRIGDAVMFVTNAPGVACNLALDLIEACAAASLPKVRVGLAFGDVMVRQGDFYGVVVNLAARLVAAAEPGTALTDREMHDRLRRVRIGYAFVASGRLNLSGFVAPVESYQLLRP
jgi:adenylate cyclase